MVLASSEPHAEEIKSRILPKMDTVEHFVEAFAATCPNDAAVGAGRFDREQAAEEDNAKPGLSNVTAQLVEQFLNELTPTGKCFANILVKTHTGAFAAEFLAIADAEAKTSTFNFSFPGLFAGDASEKIGALEVPLLHDACLKWINSTLSQPAGVSAGAASSAIGDADRVLGSATDSTDADEDKARSKTAEKLEELLKAKILLGVLENSDYSPLVLTRTLKQRETLEALQPKTTGKAKSTLFLLNPELFPIMLLQHSPDMFRGQVTPNSREFPDTLKWIIQAKSRGDSVAIGDGRSDSMRDKNRKWLKSALGDDYIEHWIVYDIFVRNPKRKLAWCGANIETVFAILPAAAKGQRKLIARDLFTKSGESTNFSRSYTGVPFRNLNEIPRLTDAGKKQMLGASAVGAFARERVAKEIKDRGHPYSWAEWKPVRLFSTFCRDLEATDIVDATPGSGAAALAAMYNDIPYFGICYNEAQFAWLMDLFRKAFLALVADKKIPVEKEVMQNVNQYLQRTAEAAKQLLPKDAKAMECHTGNDDSEEDEKK